MFSLAAVDHPSSSAIDVETFNKFFSDKVAAVRSATDGANEPSYTNKGADLFVVVVHGAHYGGCRHCHTPAA
jgi:hypothetical protein